MSERLRVVIADDEPRARQYLERLLSEHENVEVAGVAKGGGEALALITTSTCPTCPGSRWRGT